MTPDTTIQAMATRDGRPWAIYGSMGGDGQPQLQTQVLINLVDHGLEPAEAVARPERFLAMLRVFKPQSPMSVGVWTMTGFSAATTAANAGAWMRARSMFPALAALLEGVGDVTALAF